MNIKTKFTIILLSILTTFTPLHAAKEPQFLPEETYVQTIHKLLSEAKHSIDIYMYFIIADEKNSKNPVNILVNDLIQAKERGLKVTVYLEYKKLKENRIAYQKFSQHGIAVKFNIPVRLLHAKGIIIDNKYCIIGSTNWSRAAFQTNFEMSVLNDSEKLAQTLKDYASNLKTTSKPILSKGTPIPYEFLLNPNLSPALFKDHASKAFDLYLLLLKKSRQSNSNTIPFTYQEIALQLGYPEYNHRISPTKNETEYYHLKIRKPFRALKSKYSLIDYNTLRERQITLLPIESEESFILPYNYWNYNYSTSLSFRAKYMYLISLLETDKNKDYPLWYKSHKTLSSIYHVSTNPISLGFLELERNNIVEITRSKARLGEYEHRQSNFYRLNPLINDKQFNAQLKELQEEYSVNITEQARNLSSRLNEPRDIQKIKTFIDLIQECGYPEVLHATEIAIRYKKGTGLHSISTIINLLESD